MIRFQITGTNPVEMNIAAKLLLEHQRVNVNEDSGNRNGRKEGYIRSLHVSFKHKRSTPKKHKPRLDGAQKMSLADQCWQHIIHKTDADADALAVIVKLIEHVEKHTERRFL